MNLPRIHAGLVNHIFSLQFPPSRKQTSVQISLHKFGPSPGIYFFFIPIPFRCFFHPSDNKAHRLNKVQAPKASSCSCAPFRVVVTLEFSPSVLEGALGGVLHLKRHQNGPWAQVFLTMLLLVIMRSEWIQPTSVYKNEFLAQRTEYLLYLISGLGLIKHRWACC